MIHISTFPMRDINNLLSLSELLQFDPSRSFTKEINITNSKKLFFFKDNYYKETNKEKENLLALYDEFLNCFEQNNVHIENKELLIKFFSSNSSEININVIKEVFSLVNKNFSKFEVVFNFDEEYSNDIQLCIRTTNYKENDISSLISKVENKIIDIEDDANSTINILLYTDYKNPEFLDGIN